MPGASSSDLAAAAGPLPWHLKPDELAYIVADAEASVVVAEVDLPGVPTLVVGDAYESALAGAGRGGLPARDWGAGPSLVFYTSGTTARPKGVVHAGYSGDRIRLGMEGQVALWRWAADDVHLLCGPAYHAGPCGWTHTALYIGATTVIMRTWDAREWLRLVDRHQVTRAFMVPAHFIRLLEVPEDERAQYDLSSLRLIVHAAAPCPVPVKRRMIEWLGPLGCEIHELYGASEGGATASRRRSGSNVRAAWGCRGRASRSASSTSPAGAFRRGSRASSTSPRWQAGSTTTTTPTRRRRPGATTRSPWATSAISTTTATSTSPIGRRTWCCGVA